MVHCGALASVRPARRRLFSACCGNSQERTYI